MRSLLDTSVLLGPEPAELPGELAISSASLAELHFGVLVARTDAVRAERLRRLGAVERAFQALAVDHLVARHYGRVAAAVHGHGRQPPARVMDLLIAATAVAHDAVLYTRNAADLVGLDGILEVVDLGTGSG